MIYSNSYCKKCDAEYRRARRKAGYTPHPTKCRKCGAGETPQLTVYDNGYCRNCWRTYQQTYRAKNPDKVDKANRETQRAYNKRIRDEVLEAYGKKCICCGETHTEFLEIDHLNGDGALERKELSGGAALFRMIKSLGFPKDRYQILCGNCNGSFGHYGYCPHNTLPPRPIMKRKYQEER